MANFVLQVPSRLRNFPVFSSSNGSSPTASGTGSVGAGGPVILELPLEKIRRPLMRTRANDPNKVKELMDSISEIGLQVPRNHFCFTIAGGKMMNFRFSHWLVSRKMIFVGFLSKLMFLRLMESIMASLAATASRLTSASDFQQSGAKFAAVQRRL